MIKVFLVEDEFIIREGIKKNIDWAGHGYEFVGEAQDGELALPLINKLSPDIVITDIKMPFMNGLELSRIIKQTMKDTEIIILSGYDEFEYAKEGIQIGVAEYLLKPVSGDDLLKSVDAVRDRILERKQEKDLYEKYLRETKENATFEKRHFFAELVKGNLSAAEIMDRASRLSLDITGGAFNVVLFKVRSVNHEVNEYSGSVQAVNDRLALMCDEEHVILFDRDPEGTALVFVEESVDLLENKERAFLKKLEEFVAKYESLKYFGGIGEPVNRISELSLSYDRAARAFAYRFLIEGSRFVTNNDLEKKQDESGEEIDLKRIDPGTADSGQLVEYIKVSDSSETRFFVEEFFKRMGTAADSAIFRRYTVMNAYFAIAEFVEKLGKSRDELGDETKVSQGDMSYGETIDFITSIMDRAIELRDSIALSRNGTVVEDVKKYVEAHYMDDELSLSEIAAHVNFSSNHLSQVFRNSTGQTLIKFITDIRLNKAKELLRCSSLKSNEISERVGYVDPHYFSYLFKKTYGVTPTQYREGRSTK